ncbi:MULTISPECIES: ArsR/SmtB family transcription factor [Gordonia]|jgi:ArsR family transcriptional regulator|uniref:Transcriptional regulator n=3 Tax=Gordonia alkanivorans TaxID=84096 RepID=W9DGD3_9ACTN|nr:MULTISPECIES: metalloregulator ArsR/SmtB family transcription factor [Gordonia]AZZ81671.1 transcriptional regulator [Gordonia alkanivorans]ETA07532.1 transcriptional regulator [Gordonia alkanivorans CGMCC 6845]MDH3008440.1 metalloregulator ArsR/SmtB family transcription factor [Gordonia alkanivorans]MDH3010915.1 metalloregulator ArsR/SmtB family transcription factor [Gordonia alkanivorans]MDH3015630.1 metalloregulator ArsR/SmtB family transcription factor [Gordonia alkanivorans]
MSAEPIKGSGQFGASGPADDSDAAAREAAADLLRALASPTRVAIVLSLRERVQCVHELVGHLGLSQPLVSQHLRVLKDAGVVRGHRNGREITYELLDDHVAHIVVDALVHANETNRGPSVVSE